MEIKFPEFLSLTGFSFDWLELKFNYSQLLSENLKMILNVYDANGKHIDALNCRDTLIDWNLSPLSIKERLKQYGIYEKTGKKLVIARVGSRYFYAPRVYMRGFSTVSCTEKLTPERQLNRLLFVFRRDMMPACDDFEGRIEFFVVEPMWHDGILEKDTKPMDAVAQDGSTLKLDFERGNSECMNALSQAKYVSKLNDVKTPGLSILEGDDGESSLRPLHAPERKESLDVPENSTTPRSQSFDSDGKSFQKSQALDADRSSAATRFGKKESDTDIRRGNDSRIHRNASNPAIANIRKYGSTAGSDSNVSINSFSSLLRNFKTTDRKKVKPKQKIRRRRSSGDTNPLNRPKFKLFETDFLEWYFDEKKEDNVHEADKPPNEHRLIIMRCAGPFGRRWKHHNPEEQNEKARAVFAELPLFDLTPTLNLELKARLDLKFQKLCFEHLCILYLFKHSDIAKKWCNLYGYKIWDSFRHNFSENTKPEDVNWKIFLDKMDPVEDYDEIPFSCGLETRAQLAERLETPVSYKATYIGDESDYIHSDYFRMLMTGYGI